MEGWSFGLERKPSPNLNRLARWDGLEPWFEWLEGWRVGASERALGSVKGLWTCSGRASSSAAGCMLAPPSKLSKSGMVASSSAAGGRSREFFARAQKTHWSGGWRGEASSAAALPPQSIRAGVWRFSLSVHTVGSNFGSNPETLNSGWQLCESDDKHRTSPGNKS